jgi:tetratricopeptide (TPR) repeat protein
VLLWIGGAGAAAAFAVSSDQSNLLGILVALGIMLGLILFLFISALTNSLRGEEEASVQHLTLRSRMLIIAIIATVVAHFGEIHTGIAIASTRTHFWIWIAAMVVLGAGYLREQTAVAAAAGVEQAAPAPVAEPAQSAGGTRRQRRAAAATASRRSVRATPSGRGWLPTWSRPVLGAGALLFLMMGILSFDFVNNIQRYDVPGRVFIASMTELPPLAPARPVSVPSNGVLYMFLSTLLLGTVMFSTELYRNRQLETAGNIAPAAALIASIGAFGWVSFGTLLAGQLTAFITAAPNTLNGVLDVAGQLAQLPVFVYALILIAMLLGARFLRNEEGVQVPRGTTGMAGWLTGMIGGVLSLFMISSSNLQPIQADIIYKLAGNWDQRASGFIVDPRVPIQGWDMAIEHHRKAIQLAPNEDFYYLWLGRALLEKASSHPNPAQAGGKVAENDPFDKIVTDGPQNWGEVTRESLPSVSLSQQDLLNAAKIILERAREINPLNTDHSANLARMWSKTTSIVSDPAERSRRTENSLREYQAATTLSPNNAQIFNEWANVFITDKKYDEARRLLDKSVEIDKKFDSTRLLRASIYLRQADELNQQRAAANQLQATLPTTETVKIAEAKSVVDRVEPQWREALRKALPELEAALGINKDNTQTLGQLVLTYQQLGEIDKAIGYAQKVATLTPNDWTAYRNLALLYNEGKQKDKAVSAAQQALSFAPADQQPGLQAFIEQIKAQP